MNIMPSQFKPGMLEEYDIIEVSRTGVTGMARDSSEEKHLTGI